MSVAIEDGYLFCHTFDRREVAWQTRLELRVSLLKYDLRLLIVGKSFAKVSGDEVEILFILFDDEGKAEQDALALIWDTTEENQTLIEACLIETFVDEDYVSVGQVVLSHGISGEEEVVVPAWFVN